MTEGVGGTLRERVVEVVGDRRDSWVLVAVISTIASLSLLAWTGRQPPRIAPPAGGEPVAVATSDQGAPSAAILVHVAGAVRQPGLYELPDGARVADAIDAAGGPRPKADLGALNLAQVLVDGYKLDVSAVGDVVAGPSPVAGTPIVSINAADAIALEQVPGLGPVKAAAIVQHREEIGGFSSIDQLLDVTGIGPATLESIRPFVAL